MVLRDALVKRRFRPAPGKYYLADAGYYNSEFMLVPYERVRYHLREWKLSGMEPENKDELFNKRHVSRRNTIGRTFGVLKRKWKILKEPAEFPINTQLKIVLALTAVHNFIKNMNSEDEDFIFSAAENIELSARHVDEEGAQLLAEGRTLSAQQKAVSLRWAKRRDRIAQAVWDDWKSQSDE